MLLLRSVCRCGRTSAFRMTQSFAVRKSWMSDSSTSSSSPPHLPSPNASPTEEEIAFKQNWESLPLNRRSPLGPLTKDFKGHSLKWNVMQILSHKTMYVLWCLEEGDKHPPHFVAGSPESDQECNVSVKVYRNGDMNTVIAEGHGDTRLKAEMEAAKKALNPAYVTALDAEIEDYQESRKETLKTRETRDDNAYTRFLKKEVPLLRKAHPGKPMKEILPIAARKFKAHKESTKRKLAADTPKEPVS
mmetsp:Transcript_47569/g.95286  ORF Transcript_47569/g.95286 Transcript_47569/m.95286 type:complete len:246 (-) Transcript_47569:50-787(-)